MEQLQYPYVKHNHLTSAAGLVTREDGCVLLVLSPRRGWEFPGGMIEPGEPVEEALRREIREESGVEVEITSFVGISKNVVKNIVNLDFRCSYAGGELATSDESPQVGWFTKEKAIEMVTDPLIKKRFMNMLGNDGMVHIFAFVKEPYEIISEVTLPVKEG